MQQTSQLYKDIVTGENHWFETKVVINGQTFGEDQILSLHRERLGMSQSKPTVGGALSSTMTLTLLSKADKGDIVDVSINTLPYKTTYADGELVTAAKLEGLSVKVLYTSGEYEIVPYDGDIVHTNPDVPFVIHFGDSTTTSIDVGYTETTSPGQQYTWFTEFNVTKVDATVEYIELDVPVELLKFYVGEPFNVNGLVVTAHYTNNTTADVTSECVYDPAVGTVLTEIGALNVTVSYAYRGTTVTGGFVTKVFETDDTLLHFTLTSNLTQPLYFTQSAANGVTINWGDGSTPETVADLSASASHTYAEAGNYVVRMTAGEGVTWSPGAAISGTTYALLGKPDIGKSTTYPTLTKVILGSSANLDRAFAFTRCTELTEIQLPNSITTIADEAFWQCDKLTSINLPNGLLSIGIAAFYLCERLYHVTIPNSVTEIGDNAFWGSGIKDITIPSSVLTVKSGAFSDCASLVYAEIGAAKLEGGAFDSCENLESVWLRSSVTTMLASGNTSGPFYQCQSVTIYAEVASKPNGWGQYYDVVRVASSEGTETITRAPKIWGQTTRPW